MINYWWEIEPENGLFTVYIKANSDTINIEEGFTTADNAEFYAESYIRGFKDGRGELES